MKRIIKTVIAKYNDKPNRITGGKRYSVIGEIPNEFYKIINDDDQEAFVYMHRFESEHLSNAKRIADETTALAERIRIRDDAAEAIRRDTETELKNYFEMTINNCETDPNIEVLEQLREILRVPEGENIITHAKVVRSIADVLIDVFPGVKK